MSKNKTSASKNASASLTVEATNVDQLINELAGIAQEINCVATGFYNGAENTNSSVPVIYYQYQFGSDTLLEQVCSVGFKVIENGLAITKDSAGNWINRSQKFQITAERINSVTGETFKVRGTAFEEFKVIADAVKASGKLKALINGVWVAVGFKSFDADNNPAYQYQENNANGSYEGLDDVPSASKVAIPFSLFSVERDGRDYVSVSPQAVARYATY